MLPSLCKHHLSLLNPEDGLWCSIAAYSQAWKRRRWAGCMIPVGRPKRTTTPGRLAADPGKRCQKISRITYQCVPRYCYHCSRPAKRRFPMRKSNMAPEEETKLSLRGPVSRSHSRRIQRCIVTECIEVDRDHVK